MELHQGRIWPLVHTSLMGNLRHRTSQPDRTDQFLWFPEVQEYDAMEGQDLSVHFPYNTQDYKEKKAWCRSTVQNEWDVLVNTDHGYLRYQNRAQKGKARIHDNSQKGIVTITMEKLQVDDAGVYRCARYEPPRLYRIIEIKLALPRLVPTTTTSVVPVTSSTGHTSLILSTASAGVTSPNSSSLDSRSTFLWLGVGFLINKTLLAVMIALPVRRRNRLGGSTQTPIHIEFMGNGAAEVSTGDLSEGVRS
nr:triggering receptor expressed on myeloid cells 1-like [Chrysemys picta bellii]